MAIVVGNRALRVRSAAQKKKEKKNKNVDAFLDTVSNAADAGCVRTLIVVVVVGNTHPIPTRGPADAFPLELRHAFRT